MDKLSKTDPDFYSKIANMRKVKSGGKFFKNTEAARNAQKKSVQSRLRKAGKRPEDVEQALNEKESEIREATDRENITLHPPATKKR